MDRSPTTMLTCGVAVWSPGRRGPSATWRRVPCATAWYQGVAQTLESRSLQPSGPWEFAVAAPGGWPALAAVAAPSLVAAQVVAGLAACWGDRVPPQLEQVVGAAQQLPLRMSRGQRAGYPTGPWTRWTPDRPPDARGGHRGRTPGHQGWTGRPRPRTPSRTRRDGQALDERTWMGGDADRAIGELR
jgi:hypothetical protein